MRSPGLAWNCHGDMWAAVSPLSTGLSCVSLESPGSGGAEEPGWPCLAFLPAALCCRSLSSGRAARPPRVGMMAKTLSLCWSFVLPGYTAGIFLGCHEQRGPCGDLAESLQEREPDLSQSSPLPLPDRKITQPFCDLGFVPGEGVMTFIMRPVD